MPEPKDARVHNASDVKQQKEARKTIKTDRDQELADLYAVLDTPEGKRVMLRFMNYCGVFKSIMQASAFIYYNSGQQDVGHYILAEISEAHPDAHLDIMIEAHRKDKENRS